MHEKRYDIYGNPIRFTGTRITSSAGMEKRRRGDYYTGANLDLIDLDALIKHHLCKGEYSECVRKRSCDCLDVCRFGQRYIMLTKKPGATDPPN